MQKSGLSLLSAALASSALIAFSPAALANGQGTPIEAPAE